MIKKYCDRCGKEVNSLFNIKIPDIKNSTSFENKTFAGCIVCKEEADKLYDKLTDIRFILFKDFMEGGAE